MKEKPFGRGGRRVKFDLTGKRYGMINVIKISNIQDHFESVLWDCICDCGNKKRMTTGALRHPKLKSCGCLHYTNVLDESGKIFNNIFVIKRSRPKNIKDTGSRWESVCVCGKKLILTGNTVRNERINSCGCINTRVGLGKNVSAFNSAYHQYTSSAKRNERKFELTKEEFKEMTQKNCHYCNIPPDKTIINSTGIYLYNGIDRVDNLLDYVKGNMVPCCIQCNLSKSDTHLNDFLDWISRAYTHLKSTGQIP